MDQFDRALEAIRHHPHERYPVSILILGGKQKTINTLRALLEVDGHTVGHVKTLFMFEKELTKKSFEVIITVADAPNIQYKKVFELVSLLTPTTPVVGFSTSSSHEATINFIRDGGADLFCLPQEIELVPSRIEEIISRAYCERVAKEATSQTTDLCHAMNEERHRIEEENHQLSDELANSFCDTKKKMQQVAIGAEFKTLVTQELDIESMLRTALGYMLTRLGSLNAAVFLRDGEVDWTVGAFINFDRQEDQFQSLINTMMIVACPTIASDHQLKRFTDGEMFANFMGLDPVDYAGNEVVSFGCYYKKRCMAVMVLFRSELRPFETEAIDTMDTIRTVFGQQLAAIAKIYQRSKTHWPSESIDDDDWSLGRAA